jgi:hypothetical protein
MHFPSPARALVALASAGCLVLGGTGARADPSKLQVPIIYNYGENETTRSGAMGGALRALGNGTTALLLNPAALVETRVYHLEAQAQITPETSRQVYGGTIVDSVTGRLAGGLSIMGGFMDPDGINRSGLEVRLGLAYPITERLFVGIIGKYAKIVQSGPDAGTPGRTSYPFGPDDKISGGLVDDEDGGRFPIVNRLNVDLGVAIKVTDNIFIGVLGQNLAYADNGVMPTVVGGGIGFTTKDFSIEGDGLCDFNSWTKPTGRFSAGADYLLLNHVPLRIGYKFDQGANNHTLSGGLGFVSTSFSIEASVKRTLTDPGATTIFISAAYFLESSGLTRTTTDF